MGADSFALSALIQQGFSSKGVVFSAWDSISSFPASVRPQVLEFITLGGQVVWGAGRFGASRFEAVSALLGRNRRLVSQSTHLVAFLHGSSRGTLFTVRQAVASGIPVVVFLCGGGASMPPDLASRCSVVDVENNFKEGGDLV